MKKETSGMNKAKDDKSSLLNKITTLEKTVSSLKKMLAENEEKQQSFIKTARDVIYALSPEGNFLSLNPAFEQLTGWNISEWIGKPFLKLIHPDDKAAAIESFQSVLKGETRPYIELRILTKAGEYLYGEFRSVLNIKEGSIIGAQGIAHDITERKISQEKLRKYRTRLEELVGERTEELKKANIKLKEEIAERKKAEERLHHSLDKLKKSLNGTVNALAAAVEKRDPYTSGHQMRVSKLACAIAKEMRLSKTKIDGIRIAGLLHDIGKITIPAEILNKPGKLTETEFALIKNHTKIGCDILKEIDFPIPVSEIVSQHHERIDGSGYSSGLTGDNILLEARILTVADVVEAMSSHRPYRPVRGLDKALKEISVNRGIFYDPKVVDACIRIFSKKKFKF